MTHEAGDQYSAAWIITEREARATLGPPPRARAMPNGAANAMNAALAAEGWKLSGPPTFDDARDSGLGLDELTFTGRVERRA